MGSDSFSTCWVFWQDDVRSPSKGLSSFKPLPPPPPLAQGNDRPPGQPRKLGREDLQPPSSVSSHSGTVFSAPQNCSPPAGTVPTPGTSSAQDSPSSPIYASVSPANPGSKRPLDAHLALVNQHPIGPFPRVQSPPHLKSPSAEATVARGCLSPLSPSSHPDQTDTNQHFVMVEVHRPDSEPDVNEVRALPQTRSEYSKAELCGPCGGGGPGPLWRHEGRSRVRVQEESWPADAVPQFARGHELRGLEGWVEPAFPTPKAVELPPEFGAFCWILLPS
ncbi:hypothetical protein P7K49_001586 [Saguinus oedipus]|uniref:Uncharacterized protein n=1 Tax=Saguinus oedipus TaxID=9490 RepID=A0ABQ9WEW8_SAGOE|nr:hypothetical protein P7K49_001586 [Saguinus oedipus]